MKRLNLLALFVAVCAIASAQSRPTHEQYVKIGGSTPWYTAYQNWQPGTALYNGDSDALILKESYYGGVHLVLLKMVTGMVFHHISLEVRYIQCGVIPTFTETGLLL